MERAGNLARYATGIENETKEEKEEENTAGNCKQTERKPVRGNQGWENENAPTLAPRTLGIHGGAAERFTKKATTFPAEENTPLARTKARSLHRLMIEGKPILKNTIGGVNVMGRETERMEAPTARQQQGVRRRSTVCPVLMEAVHRLRHR